MLAVLQPPESSMKVPSLHDSSVSLNSQVSPSEIEDSSSCAVINQANENVDWQKRGKNRVEISRRDLAQGCSHANGHVDLSTSDMNHWKSSSFPQVQYMLGLS